MGSKSGGGRGEFSFTQLCSCFFNFFFNCCCRWAAVSGGFSVDEKKRTVTFVFGELSKMER